MQYVKFYRTKDLVIAAVLYSQGIRLDDVEHGNPCFFVFEDEERCQKIVQRFINNELIANVKNFSDALKTVKDTLFQ